MARYIYVYASVCVHRPTVFLCLSFGECQIEMFSASSLCVCVFCNTHTAQISDSFINFPSLRIFGCAIPYTYIYYSTTPSCVTFAPYFSNAAHCLSHIDKYKSFFFWPARCVSNKASPQWLYVTVCFLKVSVHICVSPMFIPNQL